jgi:hypothetical protein
MEESKIFYKILISKAERKIHLCYLGEGLNWTIILKTVLEEVDSGLNSCISG